MTVDWSKLKIIDYPDPRLRQSCAPVNEFTPDLAALARRMLELMREHKGVGLAAAQVAIPIRLFVMNVTEDPANDQVYCNPQLTELEGAKEDEEGCLSIPDLRVGVRRALRCTLNAVDLSGKPVTRTAEGFECRVWQHETDHLNGVLIIDRMSPGDKISAKKTLRELEAAYESRRGR